MSVTLRVALAVIISTAFAANAMAQKAHHQNRLKPFTAEEKLYFERASLNGDGHGGGGAM
jgi:hypothetical protein